jgi:hypothetical protein
LLTTEVKLTVCNLRPVSDRPPPPSVYRNHYGFFLFIGIVALLTVMSSRRARYEITASTSSFTIWPEMSGPIDLFLSVAANLLMILVLMAKGAHGLEC